MLHHQKLGQSKEEFLRLNAAQMACAGHVLILLTEAATNSPFVFHELLFSDWLGKKIVTAMFKNTWTNLRPSLKAVLGRWQHWHVLAMFVIKFLDVVQWLKITW